MPATTTHFALPYPLGTDPIADGDDQIKNLAEKLDGTTLWPAWTAFPFAAGWTNNAGWQNAEYCKVAGWLYLRGWASYTSGGTTTVGTLPVGFRPAANQAVSGAAWNGSANVVTNFIINTAGAVVTGLSPASGHNFPMTWPPIWIG